MKANIVYKFRTWFTRYLFVITFFAILGIICSCNPTVHCLRGVYIEFVVDFIQGIDYSSSIDHLSIWLTTSRVDNKGRKCLPRDLSAHTISAPEVCNIGYIQPAFIKGRPLMVVQINNVSKIKKNEFIEFDLFQKGVKKQTIRISVDFQDASKVVVTIDGDRHVADLSR